MSDYKFTGRDFKGISPEKWKRSYETWLILKEMGHELVMMFRPNGLVTYGYPALGETTDEEDRAVDEATAEWDRRNSSFLENDLVLLRERLKGMWNEIEWLMAR